MLYPLSYGRAMRRSLFYYGGLLREPEAHHDGKRHGQQKRKKAEGEGPDERANRHGKPLWRAAKIEYRSSFFGKNARLTPAPLPAYNVPRPLRGDCTRGGPTHEWFRESGQPERAEGG